MQDCIDDYIAMNEAGQVLELCQKYYATEVLMLSDGEVFAESMQQAFEKQKGFVDAIRSAEVALVSQEREGNQVALVFDYKITTDTATMVFTGEHLQTWRSGKIIKEVYRSLKS